MRKFYIIVSLILNLFLVSCSTDSNSTTTSTEFFNGTTITEYYLEAEFIVLEDENVFFDNLNSFRLEYVILDDVEDILAEVRNYSSLNVDSSNISSITSCDLDNCKYVVVPLYSDSDFTDISYLYMYNEGNLCIYVGPSPSPPYTPDRTTKILILKIESGLPFAITNDLSVCPYTK